jgi:hypothetical protein
MEKRPTILLIGCAALAGEVAALSRLNGWDHVDTDWLPATLHNRPEEIPAAVEERLREARDRYDRVFVAYADCGTGGRLDAVLDRYGVARLPGAHCYAFFAGLDAFSALQEEELGTFYLTDFLVRNFDRLVIRGLGLDRHPELRSAYFGNYKRVLYLAQQNSEDLLARARTCAEKLDLQFESRATGLGAFAHALGIEEDTAVPDPESTWSA